MALVVQSTSTVTGDNQDNLTITKPTGVQTGDLLVAITQAGEGATGDISGFTLALSDSFDFGPQLVSVSVLYRIADASDVSASNYTVTATGSNNLGNAAMMRISGWTSGNPFLFSSLVTGSEDAASYAVGATVTITRPAPSLMLMVVAQGSDDNAASFSGYSVTSGEANPTWTEVADLSCQTSASAYFHDVGVAYANTSNLSDITAWTSTVTSATTGAADGYVGILGVILEPQNVTTDVSHIQNDATVFGPTVTQVNVNPDIHHLDTDPDVHGLDARATAPTQWDNPTKPTTTWRNPNK